MRVKPPSASATKTCLRPSTSSTAETGRCSIGSSVLPSGSGKLALTNISPLSRRSGLATAARSLKVRDVASMASSLRTSFASNSRAPQAPLRSLIAVPSGSGASTGSALSGASSQTHSCDGSVTTYSARSP